MNIISQVCNVGIEVLPGGKIPVRQTEGSSGYDLYAHLNLVDPDGTCIVNASLTILPHNWSVVGTGIKLRMPLGLEAQVRPRSGMAAKHGVTVLNSPGTIDADYAEQVGVILINHSDKPFTINHGDRIAQLVFQEVATVWFHNTEVTATTSRTGGFGSTGHV